MDKRYQVFVSSTYTDLKEERSRVIQTLMELDCIPSGMELFPAMDEEQFKFIKKVIDDCDYYVLIIGGRYGSVTAEGMSYTEMEYDYAVQKGLSVLAFIHGEPDTIAAGKTELDGKLRDSLKAFREKVRTGRLVKEWKTADQLPGLLALSLPKTIKTYPAIGWVRANQASDPSVLTDLNTLRKRNDELEVAVASLSHARPQFENLAGLDETIEVGGHYWKGDRKHEWSENLSWKQLFYIICPYLLEPLADSSVKARLDRALFEMMNLTSERPTFNDQTFQTIKLQFMALRLVDVKYLPSMEGSAYLYWSLTEAGKNLMMELRAVRSSISK